MTTILNTDLLQIGGVTLADSSAISFPSSQRKTYTPTVTLGTGLLSLTPSGGGYIDIGAVKLCWAKASVTFQNSVSQSGTCTISLPSGLFSTILSVQLTVNGSSTVTQGVVLMGNPITTQIPFGIFNSNCLLVYTVFCPLHVWHILLFLIVEPEPAQLWQRTD